ncbi:receptor-like protein EIX2 [Ricinus communis]|uniref:receptor-like protein EIX2 n=1 Tax=Ricinus communis TaxID=3988 RepID=UPI00201A2E5E|nr:receptor-like protein EIX2 [Ricinus communis]
MDCLESDREALDDFRKGLTDSENHLSSWHGRFAGTIPPNLGNMSALRYLNISSANLKLAVDNVEWVSGLTCLKYLALDFVDLSMAGSDWIAALNVLPHLTELHLSFCNLYDSISDLKSVNFSSLAVIDLSFNHISSKFPNWVVNISSIAYVDLGGNKLHGRIPLGLSELPNLQFLDLSSNYLYASSFQLFRGSWKNLEALYLSSNHVHGKLPASIGNMTSLSDLSLSDCKIDGTFPSSIGKLCSLEYLDFFQSNLTGSLPEVLVGADNCFSKSPFPLLQFLMLGDNQLVGKLPNWLGELQNLVILSLHSNLFHGSIPASFGSLKQLTEIYLNQNQLNGTLPDGLGQLSKLSYLDVSSNYLTGTIPTSWGMLSNLSSLDVSFNPIIECLHFNSMQLICLHAMWVLRFQPGFNIKDISLLQGKIPNSFKVGDLGRIDLSFNNFEGPIPIPSGAVQILNLSNNKFSSTITEKIFFPGILFISLAGNQLTGPIPDSIGEMQFIVDSVGKLTCLQTLHLRNNNISGELPLSFQKLSSLETLDVGENRLTGEIPEWIGNDLSHLRILVLRSNAFSGGLPSTITNLSYLLAENHLTGAIPASLDNIKAMTEVKNSNQYLHYVMRENVYYEENILVNTKGETLRFTKTISLLTCIDLSGNRLHGVIPEIITNLAGLVVLNLSSNYLTGQIPSRISELRQLSSFDFSSNMFSGPIPPSMSSLSFLGYLNLSDNNLSGRIPFSGQLSTFQASSFACNPGLCGVPLVVPCPGDYPTTSSSNEDDVNHGYNYSVDYWFYSIIGLGFGVGISVPYFVFVIQRSWGAVYFSIEDNTVDKLLDVINIAVLHFRNYSRSRSEHGAIHVIVHEAIHVIV